MAMEESQKTSLLCSLLGYLIYHTEQKQKGEFC